MQRTEDFVGDLVTGVLDVFQVARFAVDLDVVVEQVVQQSGAFEDVFGGAIEQIEEAFVLRDQSKASEHGGCAPSMTDCSMSPALPEHQRDSDRAPDRSGRSAPLPRWVCLSPRTIARNRRSRDR